MDLHGTRVITIEVNYCPVSSFVRHRLEVSCCNTLNRPPFIRKQSFYNFHNAYSRTILYFLERLIQNGLLIFQSCEIICTKTHNPICYSVYLLQCTQRAPSHCRWLGHEGALLLRYINYCHDVIGVSSTCFLTVAVDAVFKDFNRRQSQQHAVCNLV